MFASLRFAHIAFFACLLMALSAPARAQPTIVATWNAAALQEVRMSKLGPPLAARALAIAHTCMYDAWAAYDGRAIALVASTPRRPSAEFNDANKAMAVSYAAYRCLLNLYPEGASRLSAVMTGRGYDPSDMSGNLATPQGVGNAAAAAVIASRRNDGANQYAERAPVAYADYTGFLPMNDPMPFCLPSTVGPCPLNITDPYHWQPLINNLGARQRFVAPYMEQVKPFALTSAAQFDGLPSVASGPNYQRSPAAFQADIAQMVSLSGALTAQQKLSVEYWADGPNSELPPGHWGLFAQHVSKRDSNSIDKDVKMFFAMHNASFDAGIVAWHLKRKYVGVRPITAVRFFRQGTQVFAWGGPGQPNKMIDGGKWTPYNPGSNLTPAFPGFVSGHSTFSAASATVLRAFTGTDNLAFSTVIPADFGRVEADVPPVPTTISYATLSAAVADAGLSRLYAGIHFADDNTIGQDLGNRVGTQAWEKAQFLFDGGLGAGSNSMSSSSRASSLAWQHTVDALSNRLLVVGVTVDNATNTVQSVSYGGQPLTRLGSQNAAGNATRAELWYRVGPPVGTATVTVQMGQFNDVVAGATTYTGVNQLAPFGTFRAASDRGNNMCVSLANEPAPLVTTVQAAKGNANNVRPGAGQLSRWLGMSNSTGFLDNFFGRSDVVIGKGATYQSAPVGSVCSGLDSPADWAMVAVPLKPAF